MIALVSSNLFFVLDIISTSESGSLILALFLPPFLGIVWTRCFQVYPSEINHAWWQYNLCHEYSEKCLSNTTAILSNEIIHYFTEVSYNEKKNCYMYASLFLKIGECNHYLVLEMREKPIRTYEHDVMWVISLLLSYIKRLEESPPILLLCFKTIVFYQNNVEGKNFIICFIKHFRL